MPRLSILLSSFNRPHRLARAIRSVLAQTYQDFELIILDDNSPDPKVREVIEHAQWYQLASHRIHAVNSLATQEEKQRTCTFGALINEGLRLADGELISYLCDSAEYLPKRCERLIEWLDARPDCPIVWDLQDYHREDANGVLLWKEERQESPGYAMMWDGGDGLVRQLAEANFLDHNGCIERRNDVPWSERVEDWHVIDWERWKRMAALGYGFHQIGYVGEVKRVREGESTGHLVGGGKSIAEVVALRSLRADQPL